MEIFWLVTACITGIIAIFMTVKRDQDGNMEDLIMLYLMPVIALFMWFMRRSFRKRMERKLNEDQSDN